MDFVAWVVAIAIAVIAWKFVRGLFKVVLFCAAVAIIVWCIYPYVVELLNKMEWYT